MKKKKINLKQLEKEFFEKECVCGELAYSCNLHQESHLRKLIKQIVESMPVLPEPPYSHTRSIDFIEEIKQWREKILKELKINQTN